MEEWKRQLYAAPREREVKVLTHSAPKSMEFFAGLASRSLYSLNKGVERRIERWLCEAVPFFKLIS